MAHIPDGFLSLPVMTGTAGLSLGALALASRRSRASMRERQAPLLGAATAFVFAAQMLNFPLGAGASAHLLGGVLVAVLAGPWAGMLSLFSVVLVQALLFQDGGIAAMGANTLNLAVVGAGGGWLIYRWQLALTGAGHRRRLAAAGVAAFASAVGTGLAAGLELGLSGLVPVRTALVAVGGAHLPVGVAEAALTVGILSRVLRSRPEAVTSEAARPAARLAVGVATAALALALVGAAWASDLPDALEVATTRLGLAPAGGSWPFRAPVARNAAPAGGGWVGDVAGAGGAAVVFAVGWWVFRLMGRRRGGRPA